MLGLAAVDQAANYAIRSTVLRLEGLQEWGSSDYGTRIRCCQRGVYARKGHVTVAEVG